MVDRRQLAELASEVTAVEPEAIATMTHASADVCRALGLRDGDHPQTTVVAKKIIEFAQRGAHDRARLRESVAAAAAAKDRHRNLADSKLSAARPAIGTFLRSSALRYDEQHGSL
ncbi:MAG: hypothetical protein ACLQOQ_02835 [Beijerinckiaceae bacterium]